MRSMRQAIGIGITLVGYEVGTRLGLSPGTALWLAAGAWIVWTALDLWLRFRTRW